MSEATLDKPEVRDATTGRFGPGNKTGTGGVPKDRPATVDELRDAYLKHCHGARLKTVLDGMATKSPVEYAKLGFGLIPKKDDSVVTRVVNMSFNTIDSAPDVPAEITEDTPGDATSADA